MSDNGVVRTCVDNPLFVLNLVLAIPPTAVERRSFSTESGGSPLPERGGRFYLAIDVHNKTQDAPCLDPERIGHQAGISSATTRTSGSDDILLTSIFYNK